MTHETTAAIRAAVNDLTQAAEYVEAGCPTGSAVIISMRDRILRLMDEAVQEAHHMTLGEIEEAERLCQEATSGPWTDSNGYGDMIFARDEKGMFVVAQVRGWGHFTGQGDGGLGLSDQQARDIQDANSRFIAASRDLMPRLLAQIKALTAEKDAAIQKADVAECAASQFYSEVSIP